MKISNKLKLKIVKNALIKVFSKPKYIALALISNFFMMGIIIWSLNLELLGYIIFQAPIGVFDKVEFFLYGYQSLFTTYDNILSLGIIVFTFLFGVNIAMLTYVVRRIGFKEVPKKSGGGAFIFAILGGGCVACGTSLLAPLLASLGAVSAPLLRDLGAIFNWLGSILIIYSVYKLSLLINTSVSNKNFSKEEE